MEFIQEKICLKNKGWAIRNKPWWICWCKHTLDCFFCNKNEVIYFNSFGVEVVPEEIIDFFGNKNIIVNIFRV